MLDVTRPVRDGRVNPGCVDLGRRLLLGDRAGENLGAEGGGVLEDLRHLGPVEPQSSPHIVGNDGDHGERHGLAGGVPGGHRVSEFIGGIAGGDVETADAGQVTGHDLLLEKRRQCDGVGEIQVSGFAGHVVFASGQACDVRPARFAQGCRGLVGVGGPGGRRDDRGVDARLKVSRRELFVRRVADQESAQDSDGDDHGRGQSGVADPVLAGPCGGEPTGSGRHQPDKATDQPRPCGHQQGRDGDEGDNRQYRKHEDEIGPQGDGVQRRDAHDTEQTDQQTHGDLDTGHAPPHRVHRTEKVAARRGQRCHRPGNTRCQGEDGGDDERHGERQPEVGLHAGSEELDRLQSREQRRCEQFAHERCGQSDRKGEGEALDEHGPRQQTAAGTREPHQRQLALAEHHHLLDGRPHEKAAGEDHDDGEHDEQPADLHHLRGDLACGQAGNGDVLGMREALDERGLCRRDGRRRADGDHAPGVQRQVTTQKTHGQPDDA